MGIREREREVLDFNANCVESPQDRQRDRDRDRQTDTETEKDRKIQRDRDRQAGRQTDRQTEHRVPLDYNYYRTRKKTYSNNQQTVLRL